MLKSKNDSNELKKYMLHFMGCMYDKAITTIQIATIYTTLHTVK